MNDMVRKEAQLVWEQLDEVGTKISQHPRAQREIELIAEAILKGECRGFEAGRAGLQTQDEMGNYAQVEILKKLAIWLDGVRNETDRTRFEQRWNTLQDEAAELRVLILRALA